MTTKDLPSLFDVVSLLRYFSSYLVSRSERYLAADRHVFKLSSLH